MRALVTGGAGFIGSHLVDILVAEGHTVDVVDPANPADPFPDGVTHIQKRLQELRPHKPGKYGVVYHLAGPVGPVGVLSQAGTITPAVVGMAEWLRTHAHARVVFVSTSEVYGKQKQPVDESRPLIIHPENGARAEYAAAKAAAEMMLLNDPKLDVRVIRPFNVAGPRQMPEGGFVIPRFIQQLANGEPVTVYGDGSALRAFTHVREVAGAIYAAGLKGPRNAVYNIGNNANTMTILTLANLCCAAMGGGEIALVDPQALHGKAFREAADKTPVASKAWAELDFNPRLTAEDVVLDYIDWFMGNGQA
jgi:UDP-glucose 4-epimerase